MSMQIVSLDDFWEVFQMLFTSKLGLTFVGLLVVIIVLNRIDIPQIMGGRREKRKKRHPVHTQRARQILQCTRIKQEIDVNALFIGGTRVISSACTNHALVLPKIRGCSWRRVFRSGEYSMKCENHGMYDTLHI